MTGASRGIGEQIARVLHRDGATVVGVDVPQAASELQAVMSELDGDHLTLDITAKDAPQRIAHHVKEKHGGVDVVVHNAGITRDKKLANMDEDRWNSVLERQPGGARADHPRAARPGRRSTTTAGSSGSPRSPASPATSARPTTPPPRPASSAWSTRSRDELKNGITINAVAPGFIKTKMTAAVPFATREVGQRLNAMTQGGLPVDVAETIAWYANPGSTAVNGNVVRVCGQMMLGA